MRKWNVILLLSFGFACRVYGEFDTYKVYDCNRGIAKGLGLFEKVDIQRRGELSFELRPEFKCCVSGAKGSAFIRTLPTRFLRVLSLEGEPVTNRVFTLKRGESVAWGSAYWGAMSYIAGKDIPAEVKCPDAYRSAEDIIHYFAKGRGGADNDVLFDLARKKQFNVNHPFEFDFPFFPYRKDAFKTDYDMHMRRVGLRLGEMAKLAVEKCAFDGQYGDVVVMSVPCDYCLQEKFDLIHESNVIFEDEVEDLSPFFEETRICQITNVFVAAKNVDDVWRLSGFVSQSSFYAPRCFLFDCDGNLMMVHALDFQYPTKLGFYRSSREEELKKYDENGNEVTGIPYDELNREFERKRNAAFGWSGPFTVERLRERVAADAERIRKARESEMK